MRFVSISSFLISIVGTFYLQVGRNFAVYCTPFSRRRIHLFNCVEIRLLNSVSPVFWLGYIVSFAIYLWSLAPQKVLTSGNFLLFGQLTYPTA